MIRSRESLANNFVIYFQVIVFALAATLVAAQEESEGGPQVSEVSEEDVEAGPNAQEVVGVRKLRLRRPSPNPLEYTKQRKRDPPQRRVKGNK